ncbi:hypothetical protein Pcinc_037352 [Petrolisthes cinctipes]|uniref:Uncharacterized protein n=1 Tax=Petrolisthes cinctipes TaxID=88211 RepID=A0AAE1ELG9_PETCI|nr:hypothetical protein Pcinc_037352 [Petrolisthes cinctipes]
MDASDGGNMCSIARSVPAHGLNGGVFPHCPSSSLVTNGLIVPHTNTTTGHANGITGHANGIAGHANGITGHANGIAGHANGITGHTNGIAGHANGITGHANGIAGHANGIAGQANGIAGQTNGISGHSNGVVGHTNGITTGQVNGSVLSNGTTNGTFTSSNGYYGFQPTSVTAHQDGRQPASVTGHQDGRHQQPEDDVEMETDTDGDCHDATNGNHTTNNSPTNTTNGIHGIVQNTHTNNSNNGTPFPHHPPNTNNITNTTTPTPPPLAFTTTNVQTSRPFLGFAATNAPLKKEGEGVNTGGVSGSPSHLGEDITLNPGVSHNYIPIGGRKRSREEVFVTEMKRMRTEGPHPLRHHHHYPTTTTTTSTTTIKPCTTTTQHHHTPPPPPPPPRVPFLDITNSVLGLTGVGASAGMCMCVSCGETPHCGGGETSCGGGGDGEEGEMVMMMEEGEQEEERERRVEEKKEHSESVGEQRESVGEQHTTTVCAKVEVNNESNAELCREMLRQTHGCEAYVFFVA